MAFGISQPLLPRPLAFVWSVVLNERPAAPPAAGWTVIQLLVRRYFKN
jgi:hypothetical protein